jgi:predicted ATPase
MELGDIVDGRYRLLDLLGEGAAGKVYRAEDRGRGNQFIALKLLHAKDPRWENFFRREFEVLSRLRHPNLVQVYDFGPAPQDDTYYFTQELVVGKPLLDAVAGLRVDEVTGLFIEICRALEFIHAHGVLHRDLKPANILVEKHAEPGERVHVLDFGLWREVDNTPKKGARWAGTPPYLASEVLRGYGHSISADLYAVGVTLFQAITRKLPHGRGTPQELLVARKEPAPDLKGTVAPRLARLINKLLSEEAKARPQTAAEVAAQLASVAPNHALSMTTTLGRARLVGRDVERTEIMNMVKARREGRPDAPRMVVVEGPDGIGKSRLAEEVKAQVQLEGGRAAIGTCMEDVRWAYRPLSEIVRALAPVADRNRLPTHLREFVEFLCPELGRSGPPLAGSFSESRRAQFQEAASDFFRTVGRNGPMVLLVDDAEFCDSGTVSLLTHLLKDRRAENILFVVTAKSTTHLPMELTDAVGRNPARITLRALGNADIRRLAEALLGTEDLPDGLIDMVHAYSEGSPLAVEELIGLLIAREQLVRNEDRWELYGVSVDDFKNLSVDGGLAERFKRLAPGVARTLSALAVVGRPSGPKLLATLCNLRRSEVVDALSVAESQGLVRVVGEEDGRSRVVFRNPKIRRTLIDNLKKKNELKKWHKKCASVLESKATKEQLPVISDSLAYHYEASGNPEKAVNFMLMATDQANMRQAFEDALDLARRAVRTAQAAECSEIQRMMADSKLGQALVLTGRIPEARAYLQNALTRAEAEKGADIYADLHIAYANAARQMGVTGALTEKIDEALTQVSDMGDRLAMARLLVAKAQIVVRTQPGDAIRDAKRALKSFKSKRYVDDALMALEVLTEGCYRGGFVERARSYAQRRYDLAKERGRRLDEISALRQLAMAKALMGERLDARRHLNTALEDAREVGHTVEQARLLKALGEQLYVSGAYSEAITRFQEAVSAAARIGQEAERCDALSWLGASYFAKGDYSRASEHLQAALTSLQGLDDVEIRIKTLVWLGRTKLAKGDTKSAEAHLSKASSLVPKGAGAGRLRALVYEAQGHLSTSLGSKAKARKAFLYGLVWTRSVQDQFAQAACLTGYAQLLLRNQQPRRALRMVRRAETIYTDLDARGELKRIDPLINAAKGLAGLA